ncbi:hypothetical protein G5714_013835 [Onychostoma macrolepis]|uniref:Uncharacterized protein n=1 Tax=Onychostoma macrolepis TaxID=369639 RepID=A0A7J6CHV2_9TELE|nr:hypothetical protein G5714_013835 [Onychostoma macrolepis]
MTPQMAAMVTVLKRHSEGVELNGSAVAPDENGHAHLKTPTGNFSSAQPPVPVLLSKQDHDMSNWRYSQHQKLWMRMELQDLGLWPRSRSEHNPGNTISLWRLPPQPEGVDTVSELPSPNFFQLHPFFIWKPESHVMVRDFFSSAE